MGTGLIVTLVIVGVAILGYITIRNGLVRKKNQVEQAFAGMDVQLKKRYDLIPNLVSTVQTYMKHEQKTLTDLTALRAQATSGQLSSDQKVDVDNKISRAIGGIMIAVENYPDLKANQNFMHLQRTLNEVEEQISAARRSFNASVTIYNNGIEVFPSNIIANMMGYTRKQVFEIAEAERKNVNVGDMFKS